MMLRLDHRDEYYYSPPIVDSLLLLETKTVHQHLILTSTNGCEMLLITREAASLII